MTMIRGNFGDILTPGQAEIFFDAFGRKETVYDKIYNVKTSGKRRETDSYITGFGAMPTKAEAIEISFNDANQGYDTTYTHVTYGLAYRITEELVEDDLYDAINELPKALAESAYDRIETEAAYVFNNAFTAAPGGASYTGGDALALASTAHTLIGGGTEQNTLSTQADLSVTSLQQAIIDIEATVDDMGIPVGLDPKILLVPNELQFTAAEILKSTYVPYSADNEINALLSKGLTFIPWIKLTDSDSWNIICGKNKLKWYWKLEPSFKEGNDFKTGDALYKCRMRFSNGYSDWRGLYCVQGI